MASLNYNEGEVDTAPDTHAPDDLQRIQANPDQFGALIGKGAQQAGQGLTEASNSGFQAAQFFGQVAADNASNDFQDRTNKLLHGDPTKMVTGPDGKPAPDTGYLGLHGRAALDARPGAEAAMDESLKQIRSTLTSPQQQLQFDNFSRRYRTYVSSQIGTHADTQANTWYGSVNTASAKLGLDHISNNADNPVEVAHGASDVVNAYTKTAELQGAQPGDEVWNNAVRRAKQDSFKAQLESISVKDPSRAMKMLDSNKDLMGGDYEPLAAQFRARADQQDGIEAGSAAIKATYETQPPASGYMPVLDQIGQKYGVSGSYLARTHQLEGNGTSPTGAQGPFQFVASTAKQYGLTNPNDFGQAADAAARLAADNKTALTQSLGRQPTDAELYIAHQQGAIGAAKLLSQPNARAGDLVGDKAIAVNGGDPNAPASAFTSLWTSKFNGAGAAANQSRKANAYQVIASATNMTEGARQHAFEFVNRTLASQQIAEEADAKAKKLASDNAANDVVTKILGGQQIPLDQIANNPALNWETKLNLEKAVETHGGSDVDLAQRQYGPGFWGAYKSIMAPENDPSRVSDFNQLLGRAGPGGDLTLAGVEKLGQVMTQSRKSVNDQAVNTSKVGFMNYAKGQLSFEQDIGPIKIRDPKGEAAFNATFIPKFEAAYDKWVNKEGKNPWEFLTKENVDKMIQGIRPKSQMAQDRMAALGQATGGSNALAALPPVPDGVEPKTWNTIISNPPTMSTGQIATPLQYAKAIEVLRSNPTPDMQTKFDKWFGGKDHMAKDVLGALNPASKKQIAVPPNPADTAPLDEITQGAHTRQVLGDLGATLQ